MKRSVGLGVALLLSASLGVATAAPAPAAAKPQPQRGLQNSKKALQAKRDRDNKVRLARKAAYAARQQAMDRKTSGVQ